MVFSILNDTAVQTGKVHALGLMKESIGVFIRHYGKLYAMAAAIYMTLSVGVLVFVEIVNSMLERSAINPQGLRSFCFLVGSMLTGAAVTIAVEELKKGKGMHLGRVFRRLNKDVGGLILAVIYQYLIILAGIMLFFLPGIFFSVRLAFAPMAAVLEGKRGRQALRRSRDLTTGHFGQVFFMLALATLTTLALSLPAFGLLVSGLIGSLEFFGLAKDQCSAIMCRPGVYLLLEATLNSLQTLLAILPMALLFLRLRDEADADNGKNAQSA